MAKKSSRAKTSGSQSISPALRHWRKTRRAERALETIRSFEGKSVIPRVLAYLRKLDPFVFEEVLLTAFNEAGFKVRRNWRYSGDGGIDGRLNDADGNKIIIQAKRYAGYVRPADVEAFAETVDRSDALYGIFVHTGRTGPKSHWKKGKNVVLISGSHLVRFLTQPSDTWIQPPEKQSTQDS